MCTRGNMTKSENSKGDENMSGRFHTSDDGNGIDFTPMVDAMMCLVVMLLTCCAAGGFDPISGRLARPSPTAPADAQPRVVIRVARNGELSCDGKVISLDALLVRLNNSSKADRKAGVLISGDALAPYGVSLRLRAALQKAEIPCTELFGDSR
jgi:biopolymer transport protein ExbD